MSKSSWLLSTFLLTALGASVIFINNDVEKKSSQKTVDIDSFINDAEYTQYNDDGSIHFTLTTPHMAHYRTNDSAYFINPILYGYTAEHIPWQVTANHGKTIKGVDQVYFWDNVVLKQLSYPRHPETTTITTTTLMVYPKRSYAQTNQPVTITRPNSIAKGVGMQADFKSGIMRLLSQAKGDYVPHQ